MKQIGEKGSGVGQFEEPWSISIDTEGNMYVGELYGKKRVQWMKVEQNRWVAEWNGQQVSCGKINGVSSMATAKDGTLWIIEFNTMKIIAVREKESEVNKVLQQ